MLNESSSPSHVTETMKAARQRQALLLSCIYSLTILFYNKIDILLCCIRNLTTLFYNKIDIAELSCDCFFGLLKLIQSRKTYDNKEHLQVLATTGVS